MVVVSSPQHGIHRQKSALAEESGVDIFYLPISAVPCFPSSPEILIYNKDMENDSANVAVIGAGNLGNAVGKLLAANGIAATLWDVNPAKVPGTKRGLDEIIPVATHVFLCVPSSAIQGALQAIVPFLPPDAVIVACPKGMDAGSAKTMGELMPELLPQGQPFAVVGGPMLAEEISAGKNAACVIASSDEQVLSTLKALLASPNLRMETTHDVVGVSLAGILKNIYAVAIGAADELALGDNEKGWLVAQALAEMTSVAQALGADARTIQGTAGLADLVATAYSPFSQNRTAGALLAKNTVPTLRGEGLVSLPFLVRRLGAGTQQYPLLNTVKEIGLDGEPAAPAFQKLFQA